MRRQVPAPLCVLKQSQRGEEGGARRDTTRAFCDICVRWGVVPQTTLWGNRWKDAVHLGGFNSGLFQRPRM